MVALFASALAEAADCHPTTANEHSANLNYVKVKLSQKYLSLFTELALTTRRVEYQQLPRVAFTSRSLFKGALHGLVSSGSPLLFFCPANFTDL